MRLGDIGNAVFEEVRFFVGPPPWHLKNIRNEAFRQSVSAHHFFGSRESFGSEVDNLARIEFHQPVAEQAFQHPGNRRRGDLQSVGEADGNHILPLVVVKAVNCGEVVIAGNVRNLLGHSEMVPRTAAPDHAAVAGALSGGFLVDRSNLALTEQPNRAEWAA